MKPSVELFQLVKSLSKSEKRFFKLSSSLQSGEKNYIKIFDAIEKQEEYDEEDLKHQFRDETFIKHFPSEKNHLYKLILKSLRSYHSDNTPASVLQQENKNVELLYKKALYKEANKFLGRAKKIAYQSEKYYYLIDLLNWEKILLAKALENGQFKKDFTQIIDEELEVIKCLSNLAEYQALYSKINYFFRMGGYVKSEEENEQVSEIAQDPLIVNEDAALSVRAASILYYVKGSCATATRDFDSAIENFEKARKILEENEVIKNDVPNRYVRILSQLIQSYINIKSYNKAYDLLGLLGDLERKTAFSTEDVSTLLFFTKALCHQLLLNRQGKIAEAVDQISVYVDRLDQLKGKISKEKEVTLNYLFAYLHFGNGNYKEALSWINNVLNDNENALRQDIYSYARVLNIMIHYELGNFGLLEYIVKSTNRFLSKKNKDFKAETLVVDYVKKLAKVKNEEEKLEIFQKLKTDLEGILITPIDRLILEYIDFFSWINSKLQGIPFTEAVKTRGRMR